MTKVSFENLNFQTTPALVLGSLAVANCAYGIASPSKGSIAYSIALFAATYFASTSPAVGAGLVAGVLAKIALDIRSKAENKHNPDLAVLSAVLVCGAIFCAYKSFQL